MMPSFSNARDRARRGEFLARLTGRSRRLLALSDVTLSCTVNSQSRRRLQTVRVERIRGSEGRCDDFDADFNPLQNHTCDRWRSIARARAEERSLPPVELVQVGDVLFVRDGHHRVSVARAMGQREIEAEVTAWEVSGSPPWESPTASEDGAPENLLTRLVSAMNGLSGKRTSTLEPAAA